MRKRPSATDVFRSLYILVLVVGPLHRRLDVLVAGEVYIDLIMSGFDFWPRPGQEAFAKSFRRDMGGGGAIAAWGLASLCTRTGLAAVVGADHHEWICTRMHDRGLDTSLVQTDPVEPTGFTVAATTPEDRAFLTYAGANSRFAAALAEAAAAHGLAHARHVHIAFAPDWDTAAELFAAIRRNGCTISLDPGWHESWLSDHRALDALANIDIFFPNHAEAKVMTGLEDPEEMLRYFRDAGLPCVALKLGARGAALLCDGRPLFAEPLPVSPVDTTGAGDCFDAGFLHSWLIGDNPMTWLATGNICGALSTEEFGGIAGFPSPERVKRELDRLCGKRP